MSITAEDLVQIARGYLDTPFLHMGRQPGLALDCVGLVICAAREAGLMPADWDVAAYTPTPDGQRMLAECRDYLDVINRAHTSAGDVLLVATVADPQHVGILAQRGDAQTIIHASNASRRVVETRLVFGRGFRYIETFRFKELA